MMSESNVISNEEEINEMKNEIRQYLKKLDKENGYAFVSYSHADRKVVYKKVLDWMRRGYSIYLDVDFENHSSDDNWVDIMEEYVQNTNCKVAICFRSANYYCSYAALLELLTIRGKEARQNRDDVLKIEIVQCDRDSYKTLLDNAETKEIYVAKHKKYVEDMKKGFLSHNPQEDEILKKGIEYFYKKNQNADFFEDKDFDSANEILEWIKKGFQGGAIQFFQNVGELISQWFIINGLTGNYKEDILDTQLEKYGIKNGANEDINSKIERKVETETKIVDEKLREIIEEDVPEDEDQVIEDREMTADKSTKKQLSVTGDITYTLYGEEYTENQSDMMLRFFAQVLKRHQDFVEELPEHKGMNCASRIDYTKKENISDNMPSYFRICQYFTYPNEQSICIGTAYGIKDKLKKMAVLLQIVGEDASVFTSEQVQLPEVKNTGGKGIKESGRLGTMIKFTVYKTSYEANQSDMLGIIFSKIIEKHKNLLSKIAEQFACVSMIDYTNIDKKDRPSYFRSSLNVYDVDGVKYSVGGGFSMKEKMKMIGKLIDFCGEDDECVEIEGVEIEVYESKQKAQKKEKNFL